MNDEQKQIVFSKDSLLVIPIVGTALAITYDVGFFYGIDIEYMSLFSLNEHIVFAFQALPFAVGFAFIFVTLLRGLDQIREVELTEQLGRWGLIGMGLTGFIGSIAGAVYLSNPMAGVISMTYSIFMFWLAWSNLLFKEPYTSILLLAWMLGGAFIMGAFRADLILSSKEKPHTIVGVETERQGRLIRFGERGLLFLDPDAKQVVFLKWDGVKSVRHDSDKVWMRF